MTQAQTSLEQANASPYTILLTIKWGSNTAYYTKWNEDLTVNGITYTSESSIKITENQQHGGTDDAPMMVQARTRYEPFTSLAKMEPMAKVYIGIQYVRVGDDSTAYEYFHGIVQKSTTNPNGQAGLVKCVVAGIKDRLKVLMGVPITSTCASIFLGDAMCKKDISGLVKTAQITAIDSFYANLIRTNLTGDLRNLLWKFGYIEVNGLRINIRASLQDADASFQLRDNPPASWAGATGTFTPGCDRQIGTCRSIYNNEVNFSGAGIAMPDSNPLFQTV